MEKINIDGEFYEFSASYKDDVLYRRTFNALVKKEFEFDFEKWYQNSFWDDNYIPNTLFKNGKAISNVSVNLFEFEHNSKTYKTVQIGTVATAVEFRNKGLSRFLMEKVMSKYSDITDFIYLFANDSVLNFYPKFGFNKANEYNYYKKISPINKKKTRINFRKLNINNSNDKTLLIKTIKESKAIYSPRLKNDLGIFMFYALYFMKKNIYYIPDIKTIAFAETEKETLFIYDIFSNKEIDINLIIDIIKKENAQKVKLMFTPINKSGFKSEILTKEDTTLFINEKGISCFEQEKIMFPALTST